MQPEIISPTKASAHVSGYADEKIVPLPYKPVSADSHVTEPPHCYVGYIEAKYKDTAPHIIRGENGGDFYVVDGMPMKVCVGTVAAAGFDPRTVSHSMASATFEELHRGGYDAVARMADQDRDGVAAEIVYPTIGMMLCNHPDANYKKACMDAYNRWLQEFQSGAPDRIFGMGQTAVRSVKEAISDIENLKKMGFRGVMMPGDPATEFDYDDPAFDALWEVASDLEMPLSFHILTAKADAKTFSRHPPHRGKAKVNYQHLLIQTVQDILSMFIWARIFERFPKLKLVCVEGDAGWAPHFMYRMDHYYNRHRFWMDTAEMAKMPSECFRDNIYLTFQDDYIALRSVDLMNPKRLLWANDFPHVDSTWPLSRQLISRQTAHLTDEQRRWILRDNVVELYNLPVH